MTGCRRRSGRRVRLPRRRHAARAAPACSCTCRDGNACTGQRGGERDTGADDDADNDEKRDAETIYFIGDDGGFQFDVKETSLICKLALQCVHACRESYRARNEVIKAYWTQGGGQGALTPAAPAPTAGGCHAACASAAPPAGGSHAACASALAAGNGTELAEIQGPSADRNSGMAALIRNIRRKRVEIMTFRRPQGLAVPIEDGAWRSLADEKNVHDVMLVGYSTCNPKVQTESRTLNEDIFILSTRLPPEGRRGEGGRRGVRQGLRHLLHDPPRDLRVPLHLLPVLLPYYLQYLLYYYFYLLFIYCALFALGRRPEEEEREE
jgi:hypothetical protein